ncbi:putative DNA-binding protein (MmcQ/YjbR family) [Archangium gephyra]|uniref:DNA-binding protein (MmcQ/YjbR family) n=1 Tax=Archangium gephyra TaxID=48 RepID=A0AAC8QFS9_9BACT|nr:MmcQ/YjbR family DNA-binding protein [Archangium gephyra]AKJ06623.1 Phosphoribosylglycinamide formyltransferase [Archangium gephyra]REG32068.1 putative DNA-binding protein (MmcQ/YjbR family) [Archangium gephyra]
MSDAHLERLRPLCLAFPEARETTTYGNPTFQAGTKSFAVLDSYKGTRCLAFKVTPEEQDLLCQQERFFVAPYTGKSGWTCLRLDGKKVDWKEVRQLLERSYRLVALKRMLAALDGAPPAPTRRRVAR